MTYIRKKFREVFEENKKESLKLLIDIKVKGVDFKTGKSFGISDDLAGVDFHKYRYFDFAGTISENGTFEITGFYPEE